MGTIWNTAAHMALTNEAAERGSGPRDPSLSRGDHMRLAVIPGRRSCGEPGIHNPNPFPAFTGTWVMDSGPAS
jgi:hypothetical protein